MPHRPVLFAAAFVTLTGLAVSCVTRPVLYERTARPPDAVGKHLKVHTHKGDLYILRTWDFDESVKIVRGEGERYDVNRILVHEGAADIPFDDILLFETNSWDVARNVPVLIAMVLVTAASVTLSAFCLSDTKACFGSCPTFYVRDGEGWKLQAEGFSTAIARRLERFDLDALPDALPETGELEGRFELRVRNEAYETHAIREARVLAVEAPPGSAVHATRDGRFMALGPAVAPAACSGPHGSCASEVALEDAREAFPRSDPADLAAKTELILEFPASGTRDVGLVLTARNSLMTTFLLYHLIALHGRSAGDLIAEIERSNPYLLLRARELNRLLGEIEVSYRTVGEGRWRSAGSMAYTGPIAWEREVIPLRLKRPDEPVEVRLRFTAGNWRIDRVALAPIVAHDLKPVSVAPEVARRGVDGPADPEALATLLDEDRYLVTGPGDDWVLEYPVPTNASALFLRSRGFYYEWIRNEWIAEEDMEAADAFLSDPAAALRALAPAYKAREESMEEVFLRSRYHGGTK